MTKHSHGIDGPFIDGLPFSKIVIFHGYVMLNNQMVTLTMFTTVNINWKWWLGFC